MTDLLERPAEAVAHCKGKRHTPSHDSWRLGCRCPKTIYAHKAWLKTHPYTVVEPAVDDDGNCVASKHNSVKAYLYAECRCSRSVSSHAFTVRRREEAERQRRDREYWLKYEDEIRRIKRVTGGRLAEDPRRAWRGGKMAVDRNALFWLLRGMADRPTRGERMAAVIRLAAERPWTPNMAREAGWASPAHRMLNSDIARLLGCTDVTVKRLLRDRIALRNQRHLRRLADAQWRAAHKAAGRDRRPRP